MFRLGLKLGSGLGSKLGSMFENMCQYNRLFINYVIFIVICSNFFWPQ